ncbi:hypothetical protein DFH08DRAFT_929643 [Mycena albidolilacea]|uniref:Uncharacterized protein n=1 Tax=Mycena albidolilacea TaxID=1033008 RepID=A0AAD7AS44_9AGAR|nr:hypothetical protein DFH08DRAFT_929643 [Mycena albidolilacea]
MSTPSVPKDRFHIMGIYMVPPQLPKKASEDKIAALIDELLLLPVVEGNALKVEMIVQNDLSNEHVKPTGYAPTPAEDPVIIVTLQTETPDHFMAMVEDPAVQKVVASAKESGLLDASTPRRTGFTM